MKITKYKCDMCDKEINYEDYLYMCGDINYFNTECDTGICKVKRGDYCIECFKKLVKNII